MSPGWMQMPSNAAVHYRSRNGYCTIHFRWPSECWLRPRRTRWNIYLNFSEPPRLTMGSDMDPPALPTQAPYEYDHWSLVRCKDRRKM